MSHDDEEPEHLLDQLASLGLDDNNAYHLIHLLGHANYVQAEYRVASFLSSNNPELRKIALMVLIQHWGLKKYLDQCQYLIDNDPNSDVRHIAVSCLGDLLRESKNKLILIKLREIVQNSNEHWMVRQSALDGIMRALGRPLEERPNISVDYDLDLINWEDIMSQFEAK